MYTVHTRKYLFNRVHLLLSYELLLLVTKQTTDVELTTWIILDKNYHLVASVDFITLRKLTRNPLALTKVRYCQISPKHRHIWLRCHFKSLDNKSTRYMMNDWDFCNRAPSPEPLLNCKLKNMCFYLEWLAEKPPVRIRIDMSKGDNNWRDILYAFCSIEGELC